MTTDAAALYVCYFGVREPLVQNQVLPYLRELSSTGIRVSLLSFEPDLKRSWTGAAIAACEEELRRQGIRWLRLGYHKQPAVPATLYDIAAGTLRAVWIGRRERVTIFHGRSGVGATIATLAARLTGGRVIFDMRGFLAEEYVDAGRWKARGGLARLVKRVERWLCRTADGIVVLTERARETLVGASPSNAAVEVIPCCVDVARFAAADRHRTTMREQLGIADRLVFVYAGSFGFSYLVSTLAQFLRTARTHDPNVYALVLTWSPADEVEATLAHAGFSPDDYRVVRAAPDEVPRYLAASDIGVALPRPGFARVAMSPTKVSEYLAAGLPSS